MEAFKRTTEAAGNRRDIEALLEELDPEVEWHPAGWVAGTAAKGVQGA